MNVEGLESKQCEPDVVRYIKSFDIFCAVEIFTHIQFDFRIHFSDYAVFHPSAKKQQQKTKTKTKKQTKTKQNTHTHTHKIFLNREADQEALLFSSIKL